MADDLFAINISGDEDDGSPLGADQQCPAAKPQSRQDKLRQTEEAFQALKATYSPKIQNGDIQHQIPFPLAPSSTATTVSKMLAQDLVHAVEELYFYRRYAEAADFAGRVLAQPEVLDTDTRTLLARYQERCRLKTQG
ncbi:hypothetical protein PspLS_03285 [Pyricularia sp. CBS 133598]|nr:hypothetical protein PspLS_03285 [Pyricularia sp. CBS 133598]